MNGRKEKAEGATSRCLGCHIGGAGQEGAEPRARHPIKLRKAILVNTSIVVEIKGN